MAKDIAPELYSRIEKSFEARMGNDRTVQRILKRVDSGKATQADVFTYAGLVGKHSGAALQEVLTRENLPDETMYWNIAERTVLPQIRANHALVLTAARTTQKALNKAAGIGVAVPSTTVNMDRARGVMNLVTAAGADLKAALGEPILTITRGFFDEFQKTHAEEMQSLGVEVKVVREYDGVGVHNGREPCQWCIDRAGTYGSYAEAYESGAFERHDGCGCTVDVSFGGGARMDPWTKAQWDEAKGETRETAIALKRQELADKIASRDERIAQREEYIRDQMNKGMTAAGAWKKYIAQR